MADEKVRQVRVNFDSQGLITSMRDSVQATGSLVSTLGDLKGTLDRIEQAMATRATVTKQTAAEIIAAAERETAAMKEQLAAVEKGPAAVAALNQQREIAATLSRAAVTADSAEGQSITRLITLQGQLRQQISQTSQARRPSDFVAAAEKETAALRQELAAIQAGPAALAALNQQKAVFNTLSKAGVTAESAEGQALTQEIATQEKLRAQIAATTQAKSGAAGAASHLSSVLGTLVPAASIAGLAMLAKQAVSFGADIETTLLRVTTLAGVAREQIDAWRGSLDRISLSTGRGPLEIANALYAVTSAGPRGAEALHIVEQAARASAIGLGDTETVTRALTAVLNSYSKSGLTAAEATDVLVATVKEGNVEANALAPVIGRVAGIASTMGVSFQEVGTFLATLTRLGVDADEAATALRGVLTTMLGPTKQQTEALKSVGLSMAGLRQEIREKGLTSSLLDLMDRFKGNEDALAQVIPNVRAMAGLLGTAGAQGSAFAIVNKNIADSIGNITDEAFALVQQNPGYVFDQMKVKGEMMSQAFGTALLPALTSFNEGLGIEGVAAAKEFGRSLVPVLTTLSGLINLIHNISTTGTGSVRKVLDFLGLNWINRYNTEALKLISDGLSAVNHAFDDGVPATTRYDAAMRKMGSDMAAPWMGLKASVHSSIVTIDDDLAKLLPKFKGQAIGAHEAEAALKTYEKAQLAAGLSAKDAKKLHEDVATALDQVRDSARGAAQALLEEAKAALASLNVTGNQIAEARRALAETLQRPITSRPDPRTGAPGGPAGFQVPQSVARLLPDLAGERITAEQAAAALRQLEQQQNAVGRSIASLNPVFRQAQADLKDFAKESKAAKEASAPNPKGENELQRFKDLIALRAVMAQGLQAEAEAAARGAGITRDATDAAEENKLVQEALAHAHHLSASVVAELSDQYRLQIEIGQHWTRVKEEETASLRRQIEAVNQVRQGMAQIQDATAGNSNASQLLTATIKAENDALTQGKATLSEGSIVLDERGRKLVDEARASVLAAQETQRHADAIKADYSAAQQSVAAHVALRDAINGTTKASAASSLVEEIRNAVRAAGVALMSPEGAAIAKKIIQQREELEGTKALTVAETQLQEARQQQAQARAAFTDWKAQAAAVKAYGSEIAGILSQYGLLNAATKEQEILSRAAAMARTDEAHRTKEEIAAVLRGQQEVLDGIAQQQAAEALAANAVKPVEDAWHQFGQNFIATTNQMILTGKADWKSLAESFLADMLRALEEWLIRYIATQNVMRAEALKTAAVNAAATSGGGGGGNIYSGGVQGLAGLGGGDGSAVGGAAGAAGITVGAFALVYVLGNQWIKTHRNNMAEVDIKLLEQGRLAVADVHGNIRNVQALTESMESVIKSTLDFVKGLGGTLSGFDASQFHVKRTGQGKTTNWTVLVDGIIESFGNDADAALQYAAIQAAKHGVFKGLDPITAAAIHASVQKSWDDFQRDIQEAQMVSNMGRPEQAQAFREVTQSTDQLIADMLRILGPSAEFDQAIQNITASMVNSLRGQRDQITGHQRTAEEEHQLQVLQMQAWNAERAVKLANVRADILAMQANILLYQSTNHLITGGGGEGGRGGRGGLLGVAYAFSTVAYAASVATAAMELTGDVTLDAMNAQLAALQALEAALLAIPPIDPSELIPRGGRPSGGQTPQDEVRDALAQHRLDMLGQESRALAEINRHWDEELRNAGHNAQLIAQIAQARREEIAALAAQIRQQSITPFLGGPYAGSRSQAAATLAEQNRQQADLLASARALGIPLWQINQAFREMHRILGLNVAASLGVSSAALALQYMETGQGIDFLRTHMQELGITTQQLGEYMAEISSRTELSIFGSISQYIKDEATLAEFKQLQYELDIARAKVEIELARASHALSEEAYRRLYGIIYGLPGQMPGGGTASGEGGGQNRWQYQQEAIANLMAEAAQKQKEAADAALEAAKRLTDWSQSLMTNPETSPLSPRAQVEEARRLADAALLKAQTDHTAESQQAFTGAADTYFKLFADVFGHSGAFAAEVLRLHNAAGALAADLSVQGNLAVMPGAAAYAISGGGGLTGRAARIAAGLEPEGPPGPPPPPPGPTAITGPPDGTPPIRTTGIFTPDTATTATFNGINAALAADGAIHRSLSQMGRDASTYQQRSLPAQEGSLREVVRLREEVTGLRADMVRMMRQMEDLARRRAA